MSVDPGLFDKLNIQEEDGHLVVPVSAVIPAYLMGSGLGAMEVFGSDYEHHDPRPRLPGAVPPGGPPLRRPGVHPGPPVLPRAGLPAGLRHGGRDHPWRFHLAGHGPGVTPIMTCRERCWCPSWTGTPTSPSIWAPSSPGNPWILSNWEPAASAASSSPWQARPSGPDRDRHLQHGGPDLHRPAPGQRSMMAAIGITAPISLIVTAFTALLGNGGAPLCAICLGRRRDRKGRAHHVQQLQRPDGRGRGDHGGVPGLRPAPALRLRRPGHHPGVRLSYLRIYICGTFFVQISVA